MPTGENLVGFFCFRNGRNSETRGRRLVLNVAGQRESKAPGLELAVESYVARLISEEVE